MIKVGYISGIIPKFALPMNVYGVISILACQVFRNLKERDAF